MELSAANVVLVAKQHQISELKRLASTAQFVGVIGHLIHVLQIERGASSIYLASSGKRFATVRLEAAGDSESVERELRVSFETQLRQASHANARLLSLIAWVLLGLDTLPDLRQRISERRLTANESVAAFSRLIAGLVSLIFELADAAIDARISGLLVALFNLVQGKELAGQERAVGALLFASGVCDGAHQQRVLHLIDGQERNFRVFVEFAEPPVAVQWQEIQSAPYVAQLERLRRVLFSTKPGAPLDANLSDQWFEYCSERLVGVWSLQRALVASLQDRCATLVAEAERDLLDAEGLLDALRGNPPARAELSDRFYDPAVPVEHALSFMSPVGETAGREKSIIDVLQAQSQRLASMETELAAARRALDERKTIERAKGMLMARYKLTEDAAYKMLRSTSMEQNRRLAEVAEAVLTLSAMP